MHAGFTLNSSIEVRLDNSGDGGDPFEYTDTNVMEDDISYNSTY